MNKNEQTQASLPKHLRAWHQNSKLYTNAYGEDIDVLDVTLFGKSIEHYDAYKESDQRSIFGDCNFAETFYLVVSYELEYKQALNEKRNCLSSYISLSYLKNRGHLMLCPEYSDFSWKHAMVNALRVKEMGRCSPRNKEFEDHQTKALDSRCPISKKNRIDPKSILELDDLEAGGLLADDSRQQAIDIPLSNANTSVNHLSIEHRFIAFG